ncbi:MAG: N-acetylmuramoyl-L-alanine amidase, partial [Chloroflexota bacterium]
GKWKDATGFATRYKLKTTNNPDGIYQRHSGADLNLNDPGWNADKGLPAYAMGDGVVVFAERVPAPSTWGRVVVIRHELPPGLGPVEVVHSRYAHLGSLLVQAGQKVKRGDVVGVIGGAEFGLSDHLHFDISHSGILESKPLHWTFDNLNEVLKHYLDPREFLLGKADALVEPAQFGPDGTIGLVGSLQHNAISRYAPYRTRKLADIKNIVIHHSAGNPSNPAASIAEGHINRNGGGKEGWPGIGYHYYITGNGNIYRTQQLETVSFHVGAENFSSVGVCLAGSFMDGAMPTLAQLASCRALVNWFKARLPTDVEIKKHRDFAATACPGETWPSWWQAATGETDPVEPEPPAQLIDLRRFKIAHPDAWRVVKHVDSQGRETNEDVQDLELGNGLFVRRKNRNGEWHRYDDTHFYLVHDTSPDADSNGVARVYTLFKDGQPGAPKSKLEQRVGETWQEDGKHLVQFRAKDDCRALAENSGEAQNSSVIVRYEQDYTFDSYGQALTFDEVVWEKTGVETQIYGRKDGRSCGWIGWQSPWGVAEPVELHWDRDRLTKEPDRVCDWE